MTPLLRRLTANRLTVFGLLVLVSIVSLALLTPLLPLADPDLTDTANRFKRPLSDGYLLGTDHLGARFAVASAVGHAAQHCRRRRRRRAGGASRFGNRHRRRLLHRPC